MILDSFFLFSSLFPFLFLPFSEDVSCQIWCGDSIMLFLCYTSAAFSTFAKFFAPLSRPLLYRLSDFLALTVLSNTKYGEKKYQSQFVKISLALLGFIRYLISKIWCTYFLTKWRMTYAIWVSSKAYFL